MHISDGVLSGPVLVAGFVGTAALAALTLRKMNTEEIPKISVVTAVFFVASLVHIPVGFSSVHLILNGLVGVVLGWRAFPAIMVGVTLQTLLFGHGGVTVIGVNCLMLGGSGLIAYLVWQMRHAVSLKNKEVIFGALAGAAGIFASGCLMSLALITTGEEFLTLAKTVLLIHSVVMLIEAVVVGAAVRFLMKVKPDVLAGQVRRPAVAGASRVNMVSLIGIALLGALIAPAPAHAHKLLVDYTPLPEGLLIEVFFPDGITAKQIPIRLMDPEGKVLMQGTSDDKGGYVFPITEAADYVADADAGMGHYAKVEVPKSAFDGIALHPGQVASGAEREKVSKVKAEPLPVARIAIGFLVIAALGGAGWWFSRRARHAA